MSSPNEQIDRPWKDETGDSFELGARVLAMSATSIAACAVALYVFKQHAHRKQQYATVIALCTSHVLAIVQAGLLVAACRSGWGSSIEVQPNNIVDTADRRFFASNVVLLLVFGALRFSVCASLNQANKQTKYHKYSLVMLSAIPLWVLGSVVGMALNRRNGPDFWTPVGKDCRFIPWICIYATGLAIDLVVAGMSISLIARLQMSFGKKFYSISVFAAATLANVPLIYGVVNLYQHSEQIASDPTLHSTTFVYANQIAIAISLWCRALEAARHLQRDVGHATWGHRNAFREGTYGRSTGAYGYYEGKSTPHTNLTSKGKHAREEDEVELQAMDSRTKYTASIRAAGSDDEQVAPQEIEVTRQVWVV